MEMHSSTDIILMRMDDTVLLLMNFWLVLTQQVPVVSDRLLITIISVGSGRTIAKSSKEAALNGICQWPDSILQPIRFSRDEVSQEFQEYQCKIVVSMVRLLLA
jgi:hypothetical protein